MLGRITRIFSRVTKSTAKNPVKSLTAKQGHARDTSFYNDLLLQTKYGADSEAIRQYFPLDHVVEKTLSIYQELLGLTIHELPKGTFWSWYPSEVRCFQVVDT